MATADILSLDAHEGQASGWHRSVFSAMGTTVTVVVPATWSALGSVAADLFAEWDARLSRFRPTSELSRLNAASGRPQRVSRLLYDVVETAVAAAFATDGLFDPTLLDRLEALGYDRTFDELLQDELARSSDGRSTTPPGPTRHRTPHPPTLNLPPVTGFERGGGRWRDIRLKRGSRTIEIPRGVRLDLGGIVKGMAVDAVASRFVATGVPAAAIEAGGDLAVLGPSPHGGHWRVEVERPAHSSTGNHPGQSESPPLVIELEGGALATSSIGRRRWVAGGAWRHHLIDPRTGEPAATGVWSATVAARSCTEAEVVAKVALLLGRDEGCAFLRRWGFSGLLIEENGDVRLVEPMERRASTEDDRSSDAVPVTERARSAERSTSRLRVPTLPFGSASKK